MFWLHNRDTVATISDLSPQTDNILYVQFVGRPATSAISMRCRSRRIAAPGSRWRLQRRRHGRRGRLCGVAQESEHALPDGDPRWLQRCGGQTSAEPVAGSGGSGAVPEPASLILAVVAADRAVFAQSTT